MVYIKEFNYLITNLEDDIPLEIKKHLYENLKKGYVYFKFPNDFDEEHPSLKRFKKTYKVGFLFDLLTKIYPAYGKEQKCYIISDEFQMLFTYRQFKTIIDDYEKNRNRYLYKRSSLM